MGERAEHAHQTEALARRVPHPNAVRLALERRVKQLEQERREQLQTLTDRINRHVPRDEPMIIAEFREDELGGLGAG